MKTGLIVLALVAACWASPAPTAELRPMGPVKVEPLPGVEVQKNQRIISGTPASDGQFPYQAAVHVDNSVFCGGSLISGRTILTAAHCAGGNTFTIYLGSTALWGGQQIYTTTQKIVHPNYNSGSLNNDIALVILPQVVSITNQVRPVTLARGSNLYEGQSAIASGWGLTQDGGGISNNLNYVQVNIISNSECASVYGPDSGDASKICSRGPGNNGVCSGDSGGPLVLAATNEQIGVNSFAAGGACTAGLPSGYARVTYNYDWIMANTW